MSLSTLRMARAGVRARKVELAFDLAFEVDLVINCAGSSDVAPVPELARALVASLADARRLDFPYPSAALARTASTAERLADVLGQADSPGSGRGLPAAARSLSHDLVRALADHRGWDLDLVRTLPLDSDEGPGKATRVAPAAAGMLNAATRLLPAASRARYAEEFRSELWEIEQVGGSRAAQLAYAARQLRAVRRLRAGLRVPRHQGEMP
jgi:hypothetical protein